MNPVFEDAVGSPLIVVTTERVLAGEAWHVDVVSDQHDVAHVEAGVQTSSSVGHYQSLHPQQEEHTHWICHLETENMRT